MQHRSINLEEKFRLFSEQWQPKVIAEMNEYQFKIVRLEGDFVWHSHQDTDEAFIVLDGALRIDFRDGAVNLGAGYELRDFAKSVGKSANNLPKQIRITKIQRFAR